jgi:thioredoxin-related protein
MKKIVVFTFLLIATISHSQQWKTNLEEAKKEAAEQQKKILLVFSGSDWCAPCIKLDKNVWQSEAFKLEAEKNWILVKADFPKKKVNQLPLELATSNKLLAEKYNKAGNFPLVVLLDSNGKVKGMNGFKNVSAEEYIALIYALEK